MNRKQILLTALNCGVNLYDVDGELNMDAIVKFYQTIAETEREEDAKIADLLMDDDVAKAIRSRQ